MLWVFAFTSCLCQYHTYQLLHLLGCTDYYLVSLRYNIFIIYWSFFSDNSLARSTIGFKVGQLLIFAYFTIFYAQLTKATNRFLAIFSPVKYRKWFCNENATFIIIIAIILGLIHSLLYFIPGCNFYYDGDYVAWDYDYTACYDIMSFYVDFIICCSLLATIMLIDGSTLYLIIKHGLFKKGDAKEITFFIQTFSTSILYVVSSISDQFLSYMNMNRWYVFVTSTIAWESCHVIDG